MIYFVLFPSLGAKLKFYFFSERLINYTAALHFKDYSKEPKSATTFNLFSFFRAHT